MTVRKLFILIASLCVLCSCSSLSADISTKSGSEPSPTAEEIKEAEEQRKIELFMQKYNAVSFDNIVKEYPYSVDIIDNYKNLNIYTDNCMIIDIFYENNEKYMFLQSASEDVIFRLKISDDQYHKITSFNSDYLYNARAIFSLESINAGHSYTDTYFYADDEDADYSCEVSSDRRILEGTLVDITER